MNKKIEQQIEAIEETQEKLRDSIQEAKSLADKAGKLIEQHKQELQDEPDE
jgi:SMC interacting uncharacterized protein involved in chromosome segregation